MARTKLKQKPSLTIRQEQTIQDPNKNKIRELIYQIGILKMRLGITRADISKAENELIDIGFNNPTDLSHVKCLHCNGTGKKQNRSCEYCNGLGERYVIKFQTDEMDLFDGRIYETLEYIIDKEKARAILDNKTFDAIFVPSKIDKIDVRPKAEMMSKEFDE
jgi:hypothetical protein